MKLWFENRFCEERVISENCDTWKEVFPIIHDFLEECSRKWPSKRPFEWYYTRYWQQEDGRTRIDVGSHSEFFIWEGTIDMIRKEQENE